MNQQAFMEQVEAFEEYLRREERSANTHEKYARDLRAFARHLDGRELCKEVVLEWKEALTRRYAPASVNSMLAAVNSFLCWAELPQYRVKTLKIQRSIYAEPEKELTREEYGRLVRAAEGKHNTRLALLLQTICATGIRVSEVQWVTAESLQTGRMVVSCKGKRRVVLLPKELCRALRTYCRERGISSGTVFRTTSGVPLDRTNIWRDMKRLCKSARVSAAKVFPHNLRHLFARTYYRLEKDLSRLADLLGHSDVATTRIYTAESGKEHIRQLERMGLVLA